MKVFRRTAGYTLLDCKRNEEILEEFKVEAVDEKRRRYKSNFLRHITRMENNRMLKLMLNYMRNGRRRLGRPLKRRLDEDETDLSMPNRNGR
jgi:DNA-binding FadR family transcriptional regulator